MKVTEADLVSAEMWAACDFRPDDGQTIQDLVDEVRTLRAALKTALDYIHDPDPMENYSPPVPANLAELRALLTD